MDFIQDGPSLPNTYDADPIFRSHLRRLLPAARWEEIQPELRQLGERAAGELLDLATQAQREEPTLEQYDAWGRRVDHIAVSSAWTRLHEVQASLGLAAIPYERPDDPHARLEQMALVHLYGPSSAVYTCPVSMTDAAARVLTDVGEPEVRDRVVPRLTGRTPDAWTSGQWMTEKPGGSDVGRTETVAHPLPDGGFALSGTKWFTSATTADCALALARTAAADGSVVAGSRGLGLYLVERVDPRDGRSQIGRTIQVRRLKDKLGTKSLPTAELDLVGAYATPVGPPHRGVKSIVGMLTVTRLWNAYWSMSSQARGLQLALSYGQVRQAFGRRLLDLPLHRTTLADLAVEYEGSAAIVARAAQLMGRAETGTASPAEALARRALMPVVKLLTARSAVAAASEVVESFGGAGYVENTGLPALLRDAQVLSIWEGTTNVLSLDLLRAAVREDAVAAFLEDAADRMTGTDSPDLAEPVSVVAAHLRRLAEGAAAFASSDAADVEATMRIFALRAGRVYTAALLVEHASHRIAKDDDHAGVAVVRRFIDRHLTGPAAPLPDPARRADTDQILAAALRGWPDSVTTAPTQA
ncbi:acyl-CoA dehydrogenase family protein [Euzebya tangerina]|uniref:acyl-CoA dehydrogenase family protein n=1 Tax=Euzebya tangerina TaxID=591198 RepID=UPI000E322372|nr:acyl-CoA dehydrogenase family protein [Euzebya tangerina]